MNLAAEMQWDLILRCHSRPELAIAGLLEPAYLSPATPSTTR